jgi:hypothetical protein
LRGNLKSPRNFEEIITIKKTMQKKVGRNVPPMQSSDKAHTATPHSGKGVPQRTATPKFHGIKRKVIKGKSLSFKKTKVRTRTKGGGMQKTGDITRVFKPFMA